ncbi:MAG TPA: hypothetical protein VFF06_15225 [Polyangia bacterium]|nr:hypothetical protein [Polyangia bacterium]
MAIGATLAAGCNNPSCGKGTKQTQDANGNSVCTPVDAPGPEPCTDNADAGTSIIGGICVGNTICGPGTIRVPRNDGSGTFYCQGTGSGVATCADVTLDAGNICVEGTIRDFNTFKPIGASQTVHIAIYDPLDFLAHGTSAVPIPSSSEPSMTASKDITGPNFIFKQVQLPSLHLIAMAVTDAGGTPQMFALSGTGLQGVTQQAYKLDGYTVPVTNVQQWTTMGGIDYDAMGAYVGFFFSDPSRAAQNDFSHYETTPVSGVKIVQVINGMPQQVANARYLGPTSDKIDTTLTATGPLGGAIVPVAVLSAFSGQGPNTMKWEGKPGGSTAHVVFVDRFHPGM